MRPDETVAEMAEEVLRRQAKALLEQSGQTFEGALEAVASTKAGQQLRALATGEHRLEMAQDWQVSLLAERAEGRRLMDLGGLASENTLHLRFVAERHYSWVENYMEWLRKARRNARSTTRSWRRSLLASGGEAPRRSRS
jgi:hypothetical protein